MALDPKYVTDGPIQEYFVDKDTGLPLAGGTITFYRDSSRVTPKAVFQLTGSPPNYTYVELPNPVTLSSVGTPQDNVGNDIVIYYYPWLEDGVTPDLYYLVVEDSNSVSQLTREAWPNASVSGGDLNSQSLPVQNQISNPQFTQVLINYIPTLTPSTTTYTVSGSPLEFDVAPNWVLEANGTGTITVERVAIAGIQQESTTPPYSLDITTSVGVNSCRLRQRFESNSGLWTSTADTSVFISSGIVIKNLINVDTTVTMFYQASSGDLNTNAVQLLSADVGPSADYAYYTGASIEMPVSDDSLSGTEGYVDIQIRFEQGSSVSITSIQVVPSFNAQTAPALPYDSATSNRAEALMGDYYLPRVTSSPISSLLTGWDFPLNPAQFLEAKTVTTTAGYIWDQTICSVSAGTVAVTRDSATGAISFNPSDDDESMYILQYLSGAQAKEVLNTTLSSNINAYLGAGSGIVSCSVYLYVADSGTAFETLPNSVVTIGSSGAITGVPVGWNLIPRSGLDTPRALLSVLPHDSDEDAKFSGWEVIDQAQLDDTDKFAMVVTFTWTDSTIINVSSVSLNKGDLPTRPAPQTLSDVLSECQYYYEQTVDPGVDINASPGENGCILAQMFVEPATQYQGRSFPLIYKINKRVPATVTFYTIGTTPAINLVRNVINNPGLSQNNADVASTFWTQQGSGLYGSYFRYSNAGAVRLGVPSGIIENYIIFHYSADARIGII